MRWYEKRVRAILKCADQLVVRHPLLEPKKGALFLGQPPPPSIYPRKVNFSGRCAFYGRFYHARRTLASFALFQKLWRHFLSSPPSTNDFWLPRIRPLFVAALLLHYAGPEIILKVLWWWWRRSFEKLFNPFRRKYQQRITILGKLMEK